MAGIFVALGLVLFLMTLDWGIHISQTKTYSSRYGWAGFKEFKREFDKAEWILKDTWKTSLFSEDYGKYEWHSGVVKFNHDGMVMHNPFSYFRARLYVTKYIRKNRKNERVKW